MSRFHPALTLASTSFEARRSVPASPIDLDPTNNTILGIQHVENGQDMTASIRSIPFAIPTPNHFHGAG